MTISDLAPIYDSLAYLNVLALIMVACLSFLTFIEFVRLCIVIKRSVKGRMDRV